MHPRRFPDRESPSPRLVQRCSSVDIYQFQQLSIGRTRSGVAPLHIQIDKQGKPFLRRPGLVSIYFTQSPLTALPPLFNVFASIPQAAALVSRDRTSPQYQFESRFMPEDLTIAMPFCVHCDIPWCRRTLFASSTHAGSLFDRTLFGPIRPSIT